MKTTSLFNTSKYTTWYFSVISAYQVVTGGELHHIIPRSCGGTDDVDNLVRLSTRAHVLCHILLPKMMIDRCDVEKMIYARSLMVDSRFPSTSRFHAVLRDEMNRVHSERLKKKNGILHKCHIARATSGKNPFVTNNPMLNPETKLKKIEKTSGEMHFTRSRDSYINIQTGENRYFESNPDSGVWIKQHHLRGKTTVAKGRPKPRVKCSYCDQHIPAHLMNRHVKANHENTEN